MLGDNYRGRDIFVCSSSVLFYGANMPDLTVGKRFCRGIYLVQ